MPRLVASGKRIGGKTEVQITATKPQPTHVFVLTDLSISAEIIGVFSSEEIAQAVAEKQHINPSDYVIEQFTLDHEE
jgi:hypothetical protein